MVYLTFLIDVSYFYWIISYIAVIVSSPIAANMLPKSGI
jgi:hypothetical protein